MIRPIAVDACRIVCAFFCIVLRSFYVLFFYVFIMYLITVLVLPTGVINR